MWPDIGVKPYFEDDSVVIYHLTTAPICSSLSPWRCRDGNGESGNSATVQSEATW
jgi:hypothetical protein